MSVTVSLTACAKVVCPDDFFPFFPGTCGHYRSNATGVTYEEAQDECLALGFDLPSIHDADVRLRVGSAFGNKTCGARTVAFWPT